LDALTAYGEYQPPNEEDDVSLGSSEYSKISQNELNNFAINGREESEEVMPTIIPEQYHCMTIYQVKFHKFKEWMILVMLKVITYLRLQKSKEWEKMMMMNIKLTLSFTRNTTISQT
jgi:hypothetical protein